MSTVQSRWPLFGILSLLAIPAAYPMMFLTSWFAEAIGIYTTRTNSPYAGLGSTAGELLALLFGAVISLLFGLRSGIMGVRKEERWPGIALLGAVLNGILLALILYPILASVFQ